MYIIGQEEIDAVARVVNSKALFRYGVGHECDRFEQRYAGLAARDAHQDLFLH